MRVTLFKENRQACLSYCEKRGVTDMEEKKKKKKKPIVLEEIKPEEKLKYEIAGELGLLDRVLADGWGALSAKETGRIGGLVTRRRKEEGKAQ